MSKVVLEATRCSSRRGSIVSVPFICCGMISVELTYYGHYHPLRGFRGSYNIVGANNIMCKTK